MIRETLLKKGGNRRKEREIMSEDSERVIQSYQFTNCQCFPPQLEAYPTLGIPVGVDEALGSTHSTRRERWRDDYSSRPNVSLCAVSNMEKECKEELVSWAKWHTL